jgi:hypothetical protein
VPCAITGVLRAVIAIGHSEVTRIEIRDKVAIFFLPRVRIPSEDVVVVGNSAIIQIYMLAVVNPIGRLPESISKLDTILVTAKSVKRSQRFIALGSQGGNVISQAADHSI